MPYLSGLLNSKIVDSTDEVVGKLKDVYIHPRVGEYAPLYYLEIKPLHKKHSVFVPYNFVENFSKEEISLKTVFSKIPTEHVLPDHYLGLSHYVMDQQIVDMVGARVVRVNDLRIGDFEDKMCVLGIDVSFSGLLRRLGLTFLDVFKVLKVNLIDWRKAQPVKGVLKLDMVAKELTHLHPADLANIVEDLSIRSGSKLVNSLDAESAAKVLEEIDPKLQKLLVHQLTPEQTTRILTKMSVDEVVDLLKGLPDEEGQTILSYLQNGKLKKIKKLLHYKDDTAGGLMTTDYIGVKPDWTVKQAVKEIKKNFDIMRSILYVYATDENEKFLGAVSMRWLLISEPDLLIRDLLKEVSPSSILHPEQPVRDVINVMTKYDLNMAAVVDENNKMLGVVSIDDIMRHLAPHA